MGAFRPSSYGRYVSTLAITAVSFLIFAVIASSYWDRRTTLELAQPLAGAVLSAFSLLTGGATLWHWFRPREDLPRIPNWNLKHDAPGRWALQGAGISVVIAGASSVLAYLLLSVLAQHVPGVVKVSAARLEGLRRGGARYGCATYAEFSREIAGQLETCAVPTWGPPLWREHTQIGAAVELGIKENAIGRVVVSVTPTRENPEQ